MAKCETEKELEFGEQAARRMCEGEQGRPSANAVCAVGA